MNLGVSGDGSKQGDRDPAGRASIGASAAIFDSAGRVLLVKRGKPPLAGLWSLPGGHIEPGEPSRETARREVAEETGLGAEIVGFLTTFDVPLRDADGRQIAVMPLDVYFGRVVGCPAPIAAGDAASARFVALDALAAYPLTEMCEDLVRAAWTRLAPPV